MGHEKENTITTFTGFKKPTTTSVPDEIFDELLPDLTGAELKVLLYICRRTFGFKKDRDKISLNQIATGIKRKDGTTLDQGTGLSKRHVQRAVISLEQKNAIKTDRAIAEDGINEINEYSLRYKDDPDKGSPTLPPQSGNGGGDDIFDRGVGTKSPYGRDTASLGVGTPVSTTTYRGAQQTVNGSQNPIKQLPLLDIDQGEIKDTAKFIGERLGARDAHSKQFHLLVASRIPKRLIAQHLDDITETGGKNLPALFTHRMKRVADQKLAKDRLQVLGDTSTIAAKMTVAHKREADS